MPSKLIGTAPNQVPSNADLGTLAYQNSESVSVTNLNVKDSLSSHAIRIATNTTDAVFTKDDNLTAWEYTNKSFSVTAQETVPQGLYFSPDGTRMYVIGSTGDDVNQYSLSTAWDVTTATFVRVSAAIGETGPGGMFFKPDGTVMYVTGTTNDTVREFSVSTPWDVSTITFVRDFSVAAQDTAPSDIWFKPDGLKLYMVGTTNDRVYEYNLSTAWDVSTASFVQFFSVAAQDTSPTSINFSSDGTRMYVLGAVGLDINRYSLSTPWDISTAVFYNNFYIGFQETSPTGMFIDRTNGVAYVVGSSADTVFQYDTETDGIELVSSSGLFIEGSLYTNKNLVVTADSRIDGQLRVSGAATTASISTGNITANQISTSSTAITLGGSISTGNTTITSLQSTGLITMGGTAATGAITIGQSTAAQTLNLATGATANATTKTVNIGTAGVSGSTTDINIGSAISGATNTTTVNGALVVTGDFTVNGTTTTINATTLTVDDKNIELGSVTTPTDITADGGGITLKAAADKTISWVSSTNNWTSNVNFSAPTLVSTATTGTAPLTVASTTRVANLNAATAGNADTVTNGVYTTGNQTIAGVKTFSSPIVSTGTFNINGSAGNDQPTGLYVADLGATVGTTLNPTFTAAIMGQWSTARSVGFSSDGTYIYGFRSHSTASTYTWSSRVKLADALTTARTIGGVSFDGSANINLPGVNTAGNQNTTGNAATVTNGVYTTGAQSIAGAKTFTDSLTTNVGGGVASATASASFTNGTYSLRAYPRLVSGNYNGIVQTGDTGLIFTTGTQNNGALVIAPWSSVAGGVGLRMTSDGNTTLVGAFSATSKSFLIDHPTKPGMKLRHGSLEGPEHGVYVRGKLTGNIIELPEYWTKLVDPDSITVQLTAIGKGQKLYIESIRDNKVYIANDGMFEGTPHCFYLVQAERIDVEKMEVEV